MYSQAKKSDESLKFSSDLFAEPPYDFENHLALKIYNYMSDANQSLSADWFEFFIEMYNIENVEYFVEAVFLIRNTISNFESELDGIKKNGEMINKQVSDILKLNNKFME